MLPETIQVLPETLQLRNGSLVLPGIFLVLITAGLLVVGLNVGTENYPFIHHHVLYRLSYAQLEYIYFVGLVVLAIHYAVYWAHFLRRVRTPFAGDRGTPQTRFSVAKFLLAWIFFAGLLGTYALGAAVATPALFDPIFGDGQLSAGFRVWLHGYFGLLLIVAVVAVLVYYCMISILQKRKFDAIFSWVPAFLSLREGHRFIGVLNWILFVSLLFNLTTGLLILGGIPLTVLRLFPLLPYGIENILRITHDIGTSVVIAALMGHVYYRLLPENRWLLRTMFAGHELKLS